MRVNGSPAVFAWVDRRSRADLYTTAISKAEILSGLAMMPNGKRRSALEKTAHRMFGEDFQGAVLPFDELAVAHHAAIVAGRRRAGRPISFQDAAIIAIARAHGAAVATRNVIDFEDCGVVLHNPWREE
jgi:hypothetical protein